MSRVAFSPPAELCFQSSHSQNTPLASLFSLDRKVEGCWLRLFEARKVGALGLRLYGRKGRILLFPSLFFSRRISESPFLEGKRGKGWILVSSSLFFSRRIPLSRLLFLSPPSVSLQKWGEM